MLFISRASLGCSCGALLAMTFLPLALVNLATCHVDSPVHPSIPFDVDVDHLGQDPIPLATREYWMRRAIGALDEVVGSPCPFAAFGAVIVNHTAAAAAAAAVSGDYVGEEVCIGANSVQGLGNPTLHGTLRCILCICNDCHESRPRIALSGEPKANHSHLLGMQVKSRRSITAPAS